MLSGFVLRWISLSFIFIKPFYKAKFDLKKKKKHSQTHYTMLPSMIRTITIDKLEH
jgi:hypothetical protein